MKILTAPSVLACNMLKIGDEINRASASGADMIHADVMDGIYVPNISFGFDVIKSIASITSLPIDAHMMTAAPGKYIEKLHECGADIVSFHNDAAADEDEVRRILSDIKRCDMKCALALRPIFSADTVLPYLDILDMVLVMTVEPGFGGQSFMGDMLDKIKVIREYIDRCGRDIRIEVDGGINDETAALCAAAGADTFVVGTASFRATDMKAALDKIKSSAEYASR